MITYRRYRRRRIKGKEKEIRVLHEIPLSTTSDPLSWLANIWPNLFASTCVFILENVLVS